VGQNGFNGLSRVPNTELLRYLVSGEDFELFRIIRCPQSD